MPRKKKNGEAASKQYFGDKEEQAVIDYITGTTEVRDYLYRVVLEKPFRIMVESILRRYPIHIGNYEIEHLEMYATSHLMEQIGKYRTYIIQFRKKGVPDDVKWKKCGPEGRFFKAHEVELHAKFEELVSADEENDYRIFESKAFSYCQTIIRNFFKDHGKTSNKEKIQNLAFEDYHEEIEKREEYMYEIDTNAGLEIQDLINRINESIRMKIETDKSLKKNEIVVGKAIIKVMSNCNALFMENNITEKYGRKVTKNYDKNRILHYLKELTFLSTKEIRSSMKQFKDLYYIEKYLFYNED